MSPTFVIISGGALGGYLASLGGGAASVGGSIQVGVHGYVAYQGGKTVYESAPKAYEAFKNGDTKEGIKYTFITSLGVLGVVTGGVGVVKGVKNISKVVSPLLKGSGVGNKGGSPSSYQAPKITVNSRGEITNGKFTLDASGMTKHTDGTAGKSQFLYDVDANKAVLDASAYADEFDLWTPSSGNVSDFANKAKVYVENGPVGITGNGELTNYINIYRIKTGYVHGCPGNK